MLTTWTLIWAISGRAEGDASHSGLEGLERDPTTNKNQLVKTSRDMSPFIVKLTLN